VQSLCHLSCELNCTDGEGCERATHRERISWVNAFHGHVHNHMCQLQYHPLYLPGTGLEDFETCEHVFSSSNATASLIHHASHFHYVQYLSLHFSQWDANKYAELSMSPLFGLV